MLSRSRQVRTRTTTVALPLLSLAAVLVAFVISCVLAQSAWAGPPLFGAPTTFATGAVPRSVATGDLNGDAKLDLAAANSTGDSV